MTTKQLVGDGRRARRSGVVLSRTGRTTRETDTQLEEEKRGSSHIHMKRGKRREGGGQTFPSPLPAMSVNWLLWQLQKDSGVGF